jgi:methyl-accepting chemotaxis protein
MKLANVEKFVALLAGVFGFAHFVEYLFFSDSGSVSGLVIAIVFILLLIAMLLLRGMHQKKANLSDVFMNALNDDKVDIAVRMKDENFADEFNQYISKIDDTVVRILHKVADASEVTMPTTTAAIHVHNSVEKNVEIAESVAAAGEEMGATIEEIVGNIQQSMQVSEDLGVSIGEGKHSIENAANVSDSVRNLLIQLNQQIESLSSNTKEIDSIINVINDISEQTNLLALNAAIEAARAGEAGRGFAVVADEVRKLAEKTQESTKDIENRVGTMLKSMSEVVSESQGAIESVEEQKVQVDTAAERFFDITNLVNEFNEQFTTISTAVEQQSTATSQVAESAHTLASFSNETKGQVSVLIDNVNRMVGVISDMASEFGNFKISRKSGYFASAKIGHTNYMKKVFDCFEHGTCSNQLPDHRTCEFGKFYYGDGEKLFGSNSEYRAIEPIHEMVHTLGSNCIELRKNGKYDEAEAKLDELSGNVNTLVGMLDSLMTKVD